MEKHPHFVKGKRILDLGSGTGITGFVAAALGASEVYVTEYDNKILMDLLERNVKLNEYKNGSKVFAKALTWGNQEHHKELNPPFDLIIGSDLLYQERWVQDLLNTFTSCLSKDQNSKIIISYKKRPGKEAPFLLLREAQKLSFKIEKVDFESLDPCFRDPQIEIVHIHF